VELRTPAGLHLGDTGKVSVENARIRGTVGRVARGLYWHVTRTVFPPTQELVVREADELMSLGKSALERLGRELVGPLLLQPQITIGDRTFRCWLVSQERDGVVGAAWLMRFYDSVDFLVLSAPSEEDVSEEDDPQSGEERHGA